MGRMGRRGRARLLGLVTLGCGLFLLGMHGLGSPLILAAFGVVAFAIATDNAPKWRGTGEYRHTRRSFLRYAAVGTAAGVGGANRAVYLSHIPGPPAGLAVGRGRPRRAGTASVAWSGHAFGPDDEPGSARLR